MFSAQAEIASTTQAIRTAFLEFFVSKGHRQVASSSLVPGNDPTLLFTNSGMVQFKDCFLGADQRDYTRAVSSQRCLRAGGKHNDLENVGYTARHHTFFEMLGNFSFGDYFKRDAILYAWELLTKVYRLPPEQLMVTVYHTDDEAYDLWHQQLGIPAERIVRIGDNKGAPYASDNFWQMADTGPCGPCSEIFYDHGAAIAGGPPGSPGEDGDRFIEIWNLVFMQFERHPDGSLSKLPKPCVDTGMGLERLSAVLQHVHSNYQIDIFQTLIGAAAQATHTEDISHPSLRVIADHIRACAFMIVDGVLPSNEGRGYVLRRIIRRALRHGWQLGRKQPFFYGLVSTLVELMGEAYPELRNKRELVERALRAEEQRFGETLDSGMKVFENYAQGLSAGATLPGAQVFKLYDTYGFPADLTADVARERGVAIDDAGFEREMDKQRAKSREASKFAGGLAITAEQSAGLPASKFVGYEQTSAENCRVLKILVDGKQLAELTSGDQAVLILDQTPFYAESGGQVGDAGTLCGPNGVFEVNDTVKLGGVYHAHLGSLKSGSIEVGESLHAQVRAEARLATRGNHSATHLMHAALRTVLGEHVSQKGSLVEPERLRFDFSHYAPMTRNQLREVERLVNQQIRLNHPVGAEEMAHEDALARGAMALFGEKYGDRVRVLQMGEFSMELCGGTHVQRTGDIGHFKITSESGVASGVRRIEALTGAEAAAALEAEADQLREVASLLSATPGNVLSKLRAVLEHERALEKDLERLHTIAAANVASQLASNASDISGIKVIAVRLENIEAKALREMLDNLRSRLTDCAVVLAATEGGKANLIAGVSGSALGKIKAGELLSFVAAQIGGKGGGRPEVAQGGGADGPALVSALQSVPGWIAERLQ